MDLLRKVLKAAFPGATLLSAVLLSAPASAVVFGQVTTITGYYIYGGGASAWIKTAANQNPDSCTSSTHLYLDPTMSYFKETWAAIMLAQATGSTVSLQYVGCSPGGQYPKITAVAVPHVW